jgi:hypothetical protein
VTLQKAQLDFEDIMWLRRACTKTGAVSVPPPTADKLVLAGLVERQGSRSILRITDKGRIALQKLG